MASFAEIDNTSYVLQIIVLDNADIDYLPFPESEPLGQAFIASLGIEGTWLQTSKSGAFRGTYAGIGWFFDATLGEYGEFVDLEHQIPIV
jgi:hypothetical protein